MRTKLGQSGFNLVFFQKIIFLTSFLFIRSMLRSIFRTASLFTCAPSPDLAGLSAQLTVIMLPLMVT